MTDDDLLTAIILIGIFVIYVVGLLLTILRMILLWLGYRFGIGLVVGLRFPPVRVVHIPRTRPPYLLIILIVFLLSIAWPWALVFIVRILSQVFEWDTTALSGNRLWYVITGVPPAAGVLWLLNVTYRKIERGGPRP